MRRIAIFDLGETLIDFQKEGRWYDSLRDDYIPKLYHAIIGTTKNRTILYDEFKNQAYNAIAKRAPEEKTLKMENRLIELCDYYNIVPTKEILTQCFEIFYQTIELDVILYADVVPCLNYLKLKNYTLGLWSDTPWQAPGWLIARLLKKFKLDSYFSFTFFSGDHELRKPDPLTLDFVQKTTNFTKDKMFYIGNSERDIMVGMNYGIPIVWLNRTNQIPSAQWPKPTYTITTLEELPKILPIL